MEEKGFAYLAIAPNGTEVLCCREIADRLKPLVGPVILQCQDQGAKHNAGCGECVIWFRTEADPAVVARLRTAQDVLSWAVSLDGLGNTATQLCRASNVLVGGKFAVGSGEGVDEDISTACYLNPAEAPPLSPAAQHCLDSGFTAGPGAVCVGPPELAGWLPATSIGRDELKALSELHRAAAAAAAAAPQEAAAAAGAAAPMLVPPHPGTLVALPRGGPGGNATTLPAIRFTRAPAAGTGPSGAGDSGATFQARRDATRWAASVRLNVLPDIPDRAVPSHTTPNSMAPPELSLEAAWAVAAEAWWLARGRQRCATASQANAAAQAAGTPKITSVCRGSRRRLAGLQAFDIMALEPAVGGSALGGALSRVLEGPAVANARRPTTAGPVPVSEAASRSIRERFAPRFSAWASANSPEVQVKMRGETDLTIVPLLDGSRLDVGLSIADHDWTLRRHRAQDRATGAAGETSLRAHLAAALLQMCGGIRPGDVVCDPLGGGGTVLLEAAEQAALGFPMRPGEPSPSKPILCLCSDLHVPSLRAGVASPTLARTAERVALSNWLPEKKEGEDDEDDAASAAAGAAAAAAAPDSGKASASPAKRARGEESKSLHKRGTTPGGQLPDHRRSVDQELSGRLEAVLEGHAASAAGAKHRFVAFAADATALPLPDSCVDVLASDLPYGVRCGSKNQVARMMPRLAMEVARVLRTPSAPGAAATTPVQAGRCALMSHRSLGSALMQAVDACPDLVVVNAHVMDNAGLACIVVLARKAWPGEPAATRQWPQGARKEDPADSLLLWPHATQPVAWSSGLADQSEAAKRRMLVEHTCLQRDQRKAISKARRAQLSAQG